MSVPPPLRMWTIYSDPSDHPGSFVVRGMSILAGVIAHDTECQEARTLDEARALLPPGLYRLPRHPSDEQQIVESWI